MLQYKSSDIIVFPTAMKFVKDRAEMVLLKTPNPRLRFHHWLACNSHWAALPYLAMQCLLFHQHQINCVCLYYYTNLQKPNTDVSFIVICGSIWISRSINKMCLQSRRGHLQCHLSLVSHIYLCTCRAGFSLLDMCQFQQWIMLLS